MEEQLRHYRNKLQFEIDSWDLKVAREAGERIVVIDAARGRPSPRAHPGARSAFRTGK
jgi:hypothetical protein